jgi:hypothetical protein
MGIKVSRMLKGSELDRFAIYSWKSFKLVVVETFGGF